MTDRLSPRESARLLRQRLEMGGSEIFLDGMSRVEALALVAKAAAGRNAAAEPGSVRPVESAGAGGGAAAVAPPVAGAPSRPPTGSSGRARAKPGSKPEAAKAPASKALPVLPDSYEELRAHALTCTSCRLSEGRTQVVFSDGPANARLMVVGEAPGANEDETGIPFVGAAGQYLDLLLASVGLSRKDSVYIANVLKCRPPGNRDPLPDEIETCSPFLRKQIDLVRPDALLAVGSFSGKLLTGRDKVALGKLRGQVHSYHGVPLVVTYHPAALLRNPNWTQLFWDDLQLLRGVIDSA